MAYFQNIINRILNNIYIPPRLFIENNIINLSNNMDISKITDQIYISNLSTAMNKELLDELGIKNIISCISHENSVLPKMTYKFICCYDDVGFDISQYFDECTGFIDYIINSGEKVLIHCMYGKSRSVSIVIAYLIRFQKMSCNTALEKIRLCRNIAHPNDYFIKQLIDYELTHSGVMINDV